MGARVLIVGAGPAGLAVAAELARLGVAARLVDRTGAPGGAYGRMDPDLLMTTPSTLVSLPGLRAPHAAAYLTAGAYHRYLVAYAERHRLAPEPLAVTALVRAGRGFRASLAGVSGTRTDPAQPIDCDAVVLATGMYDFPVRPTLVGLPADGPGDPTRPRVVHAGAWRIADARAGERVLIIGGASSAVEIAEHCARAGAEVAVSVRDRVAIAPLTVLGRDPTRLLMPVLGRLRPWQAPGFCAGRRSVPAADRGFAALRRSGALTVVPAVARVDGRAVELVDGRRLPVDTLILATGYRYACAPAPIELARDDRGVPRTRDGESRSHPGLFVLGAPCVRRAASQYLYGIARDAPAVARAITTR